MKTYAKTVAVLAALAMLGSACGDDDGGGGATASADDPLVQAIVDDIMADGDGLTSDRAEAECFVGGVVGELGTERLNALGVSETNIAPLDEVEWTEAEAQSVVDTMFGCIDVTESFVEQLDLGELDDAQSECVSGVVTDDVLKGFFLDSFTGDEGVSDNLFELMGGIASCGIDLSGS